MCVKIPGKKTLPSRRSKHIEDFGFQWKKGIDSATAVRECFTLGPDLCVPIQSCNLIGLELQIETKSFTKAQFTSLNHEWESYMATLLDSMCKDLGKELGQAEMETQLQRQVLTIFFNFKNNFKNDFIWSIHQKTSYDFSTFLFPFFSS